MVVSCHSEAAASRPRAAPPRRITAFRRRPGRTLLKVARKPRDGACPAARPGAGIEGVEVRMPKV